MLRAMVPLSTPNEPFPALLMLFDDAALVLRGRIEGDGFTVLPGHVRRLSAAIYPEVNDLLDESGYWNYQAVVSLFETIEKE